MALLLGLGYNKVHLLIMAAILLLATALLTKLKLDMLIAVADLFVG